MNFIIRREQPKDYRAVEELTREAFWNQDFPGCDEHFLAHIMRDCPDFIPELTLVAEAEDGIVAGSIMYTRSAIVDSDGNRHPVITFGPISVHPSAQRSGIGQALIGESRKRAEAMGFDAIVIFGRPAYYHRFGFKTAKDFGIQTGSGEYAPAHMVMELHEGGLKGVSGRFCESPVFEMDKAAVEEFDKGFPHKDKLVTRSQRDFEILAAQRL